MTDSVKQEALIISKLKEAIRSENQIQIVLAQILAYLSTKNEDNASDLIKFYNSNKPWLSRGITFEEVEQHVIAHLNSKSKVN